MSVQVNESERYRDREIEAAMSRLDDAVRRCQAAVTQQLGGLIRDAAKERQRLADMVKAKDEPLVLIRSTVGSPETTYHYKSNPCGKAPKDRPKTLLQSEAEARGLHFCPKCKRVYQRDQRVQGTRP